MAEKNLSLVILGIVAVIAVIALVLLFTQFTGTTGQGIYGGAMKGDPYPYWSQRGVPLGGIEPKYLEPTMLRQATAGGWGYDQKRSPVTDIPSVIRKCGTGGFLADWQEKGFYEATGFKCIEAFPNKAGYCCYPIQ